LEAIDLLNSPGLALVTLMKFAHSFAGLSSRSTISSRQLNPEILNRAQHTPPL
jgi:hypothetical protein